MTAPESSEVVKYFMQAFMAVVGRRTTENFAVVALDTVVRQLEAKYHFLRYIEIDTSRYSEGRNAISINPEINSVRPYDLGDALSEIIDRVAKSLGENADHFFIREIIDLLGYKYEFLHKNLGLNLYLKHSEYLIDGDGSTKTRFVPIKNSEILESVLRVLIDLLNRELSETDVINTIITFVKKLEGDYDFLQYVKIKDTPASDGLYDVRVLSEIDDVLQATMGEALQKLIMEIGSSTPLKTRRSFIKDFKNVIGPADLVKLKEMDIDLDHIVEMLQRQEHELIATKTLNVIVDIVSQKTSNSYAVALLDNIIEKLKEKHSILRYITIDKSRYKDGIKSIGILPEINSVESYEFGKALRDIIKKTRESLGDKYTSFFEDFKKQLGADYLSEIEKLGVNMHMIELRYV